jgi:putative transposase
MGTFFVCYYHIIWATKYRQAIITPEIESVAFEAIRAKSQALKCPILGINAAYDHLHIAVSIPPALAVWEWTRDIKGISAFEVNRRFPKLENTFRWQRGYSVLTFGAKNLPIVLAYIEKQKEHHANNSVIAYLEHLED